MIEVLQQRAGSLNIKRLLLIKGSQIVHNPIFLGFTGGSDGKGYTCNAGDLGSIPGWGRFPWRRASQPTSVFFAWRIPLDRGAWQAKELDTTERLSTAQISQVKEFSAFLGVGRCKSLGSLKSFLSMYLSYPGPVACVFSHPELHWGSP